MILQALNDYYHRKQAADGDSIAPEGFEFKEIPFLIVLKSDGSVLTVRDTREGEGKARRAKTYTVPKAVKRTVGIAANLLWDNAEYTLALPCEGRETSAEDLAKRHAAFKQRLDKDLSGCDDAGLSALRAFLQSLDLVALAAFPAFADVQASNGNVSFQLAGESELIANRLTLVERLQQTPEPAAEGSADGVRCLVSGEMDELARLHDSIKGVWGAQTAGANIVSFNLAAFNSYGKTQGGNAQVGKKAATNYAAALNALLHKDSKQRVQVGDASTVFWASKPDTPAESLFAMFAGTTGDAPDAGTKLVSSLYASVNNGAYQAEDGNERFYVLGLAPNAARLSVRFWYAAPIKEFALHIHQYFQDVEIDLPAYEKRRFFSLYQLLRSIALLGEAKNIPPNIAGETLRAIVSGLPLPAALLNMAVMRCRAERQVTPPRASLIKACLTRQARLDHQPEHTLTMSLNLEDTRPAYRLGRLFAALERIQTDAMGDVNSGIRDRYYGSASASPASIFGVLLKNANNHLGKLKPGIATNHRKLLGEVMDGLDDLPTQMPLAQQGLFAIGYYHQIQAFYASKSSPETNTAIA
ncbi:MAG: type I-C CRISPR-associated protein Cas8c/Csd1 [Stagnimonas sp.]|nr:type I-C CRISPR-associated protein Cas8c/Csd1 [Stagnimonas sp.]